jgi:hypothetical protein
MTASSTNSRKKMRRVPDWLVAIGLMALAPACIYTAVSINESITENQPRVTRNSSLNEVAAAGLAHFGDGSPAAGGSLAVPGNPIVPPSIENAGGVVQRGTEMAGAPGDLPVALSENPAASGEPSTFSPFDDNAETPMALCPPMLNGLSGDASEPLYPIGLTQSPVGEQGANPISPLPPVSSAEQPDPNAAGPPLVAAQDDAEDDQLESAEDESCDDETSDESESPESVRLAQASSPAGPQAAAPGSVGTPGAAGENVPATPKPAAVPASNTDQPGGPHSRTKQNVHAILGHAWGLTTSVINSGVYAGGELTFLAPLREPEQRVMLTDLITRDGASQSSDSALGVGFRSWIGMMAQDRGVRATVWTFADDDVQLSPQVPRLGEPTFSSLYSLEAQTVDLELTQRFAFCGRQLDTSFGARYAHMVGQSNTVGYGDVGNGVSLYGMAMAADELEGAGFTASIGGRWDFCSCCGPSCQPASTEAAGSAEASQDSCSMAPGWLMGWGAYWNVRGSAIWADSTVSVLTDANAAVKGTAAATAYTRNQAYACDDRGGILGIGEVQVGVEYRRCLACVPAQFFFRTGLEYQRWNIGDLSGSSSSNAYLMGGEPIFGGRVDAVAQADNGFRDLFGVSLATGLTF